MDYIELQPYHEKQKLMYCGIHTVNNLLGGRVYDENSFNEICSQLGDNKYQYRTFCCGNYDVNVLMIALQKEGYKTTWMKKGDRL